MPAPYDLGQLQAFKVVSETGSLGRAADALGMTQPALSRTIRKLEAQVGAPLFERHTKGMLPTDLGQALLAHARLLLHQSDVALEDMQALRGLARGTVRVGTLASLAGRLLSQSIAELLAQHPQLQVQVVEGTWDQLHAALCRYEVDLALGVALEDTEDVIAIPDCQWGDSAHVIAAASHALQCQTSLRLDDLMAYPWALTPQGTPPYNDFRAVLAAHQLPMPSQIVQTRSTTLIKSLVVHAGFLGWCPRSMYETEQKAGLVAEVPVAGGTSLRALTVFRRRLGVLPRPAVRMLEVLRRRVSAGQS